MLRRRMMRKKVDKNIVSLFHCDDANGTDAKGYAKVSDRQLSSTSGKFSNGNQGYAIYQNRQWDDLFLNNSWTVDYWLYPRPASDWAVDMYLGGDSNFWALIRQQTVYTNATIAFYVSFGSGWSIGDHNGHFAVRNDQWNHVAITYDKPMQKFRIYINGVVQIEVISAITNIRGPYNCFGSYYDKRFRSNSYRDEVRISKGVRWTSNFTPPTSPSIG